MAELTIQVLDGVDRGRVFETLCTPVSIGREEGNKIQLNDERVSRFHAKINEDQGMLVLTDLESTNGTRINGEPTQVTILRLGDRISIGRSVLLIGSPKELDAIIPDSPRSTGTDPRATSGPDELAGNKTRPTAAVTDAFMLGDMKSDELKFQLNLSSDRPSAPPPESADDESTSRGAPPIPVRLSPAQAAQLCELLMHLHQRITQAIDDENVTHADDSVRMNKANWQRIVRVQAEIARYLYAIGHPE